MIITMMTILSDHYACSAGTVSVIVIFLPMKHLGVLKNSFKHVRAFQIKFQYEGVGF